MHQQARRAWFLHRTGAVTLNPFALQHLRHILAAHHSRVLQFLKRVDKQIMEQELWPWRCARCQRINKKNALKCAMCQAHWTSGTRHNTQPKQQLAQQGEASWNNWTEWSQEWDEWKDADANWRWDGARSQSRSQSQASTRSNKSESKQTKGKKNKGKGKGKGRKGTSGKETTGTMTAQSPFAPLTSELPPWPSLDNASSSLMPTVTPFTTQPSTETVAQKREVLNALRTAYTDSAQMPQETKDLIAKLEADADRMEKEFSKATTKNLHSATKALGKAQKTLTEALEARKVHRNRWTQHVAEAAKTWEGQLHEFRQQQASLQEIATKARADIEVQGARFSHSRPRRHLRR